MERIYRKLGWWMGAGFLLTLGIAAWVTHGSSEGPLTFPQWAITAILPLGMLGVATAALETGASQPSATDDSATARKSGTQDG